MRLIDADALKKELYKFKLSDSCVEHEWALQAADDVAKYTLDAIKNAPTIEAVPVVHARWNKDAWNTYPNGFVCSGCSTGFLIPYPYCPNCGAKMDGDPDG